MPTHDEIVKEVLGSIDEDSVHEMVAELMPEFLDEDWEDEYDSEEEAYLETGRGEAEDQVLQTIISPITDKYKCSLDQYCDVLDEVSQREKRVDFMEIKEGKIYGYCLDDEAKALFEKPEFLDDQILFITKMMLIANRWYQAKIEVDAIPLLIDN